MSDDTGTVIVGGGQAGLAVSRELAEMCVEHVVLEKTGSGRLAEATALLIGVGEDAAVVARKIAAG